MIPTKTIRIVPTVSCKLPDEILQTIDYSTGSKNLYLDFLDLEMEPNVDTIKEILGLAPADLKELSLTNADLTTKFHRKFN